MDKKHTPGPWVHDGSGDVHGDNEIEFVASTYGTGKRKERVDADARLIAAAPEILDALHRTRDLLDGLYEGEDHALSEEIRAIDAAIAKAEGGAP